MRILVVEDEIGIASFLKQGLEEEGFEVTHAQDGQQGLDRALSEKFDLILLDWMLPKMSGIEVCKAIRANNVTTPILFLTAKDTLQETLEGFQAGANDYIKKPFSFEELLERIKVHFRNSQQQTVLELGSIRIEPERYKVFQDGEEIALTQREFELLHFLVKNKGKVCSRNQIIEEVWNIHFEYDTGVIDVFMNALRKKLHLNKDNESIKTVRGVGYMAE
jgi:DNA-binding response OmpR family regulator